ncbi:prepilin peptidase [Vibrio scophthalmi]|uniref:prepilin peptidase n=1 Tax=Vibrio scophthalmi TaxID=45658 RepID=UPI003EBB40CA
MADLMVLPTSIHIYGWLILVILSCYIIFSDIVNRVISNKSCMLVLFFTVFINFFSYEVHLGMDIFLSFVFLLFLYSISFWGGGDAKLAIAFLPAITEQYILLYLVGIGFLGGVLLLAYMIFSLRHGMRKIKVYGLPFGVPICISGLFCVAASL